MSNTVSVGGLYALLVNFGLVVASAQGADFYVSTQGSDSDPGTPAHPFRTISYAYSLAGAGDTIYVLPGVYTDYRSRWGIRLGKHGTSANPIVLKSTVRGGAVIDGQNAGDRNQGFYIDGNYNVVDGFEIRNCPNGGISIWGDGNQIVNNEIHHNGNRDSASPNGQDGVYSNEWTSDNYYAANSIHDNGRPGSNLDHGLYLCGQNETVINNLLFRNAASGLQVAGYSTVSNMRVYNNVMAWNGTSGIILWQDLSAVDIRNNIIYENGHAGICCYAATGSGVVVDHNLVFGNGYGSYDFYGGGSTVSYDLGTTISADPAFVDDSSSGFDPRLSSSSPAIQAGLNLSSVFTTDFTGASRPASGPWDLGADSFSLSFEATSGAISAPFYIANGAITQPGYTSVTAGGEAVYTFHLGTAGNYVISAVVTAPSTDNNSFYVNIDAQPTDPLMIWDIPVTLTPTDETVSWRGAGALDPASPSAFDAQYAPRVFTLSAGGHQLIVRGREGNCTLGTITIKPTSLPGQ